MNNQIIIVMEGGIIQYTAASDSSIELYVVDHDREEDEGDEYDPADHFKVWKIDDELTVEPVQYIKEALKMDDKTFEEVRDSNSLFMHGLYRESTVRTLGLIEKSLTLSTAHLRPETLERLETKDPNCPIRVQPHEHGFILFIQLDKDDDANELEDNWYLNEMPELLRIVRVARQYKCTTINFDQAAEESNEFETFRDWDYSVDPDQI